jgi:hypothetical protein
VKSSDFFKKYQRILLFVLTQKVKKSQGDEQKAKFPSVSLEKFETLRQMADQTTNFS